MQLGFTTLSAAVAPGTPTIRFAVRWLVGARWSGCPMRKDLCMAQGDDVRFVARAYDFNGALQDLVGAQDIVFAIYTANGGTKVLEKTLSGGSLFLGAPEEFFFSIRTGDSITLTKRIYWHETLIVNNDGWRNTVLNGNFKVEQTNIGALT